MRHRFALLIVFLLSVANLKAQITYTPSGQGAISREVSGKFRELSSAMDFGAIADGGTHPVSGWCSSYGGTRYPASSDAACLTAIQNDYPFVTAITQEMDWAALQAGINFASANQRELFLPQGTYRITQALNITSNLKLRGQSWRYGTVILPIGVGCLNFAGPSAPGGAVFGIIMEDFTCNMVSAPLFVGAAIKMDHTYQVSLNRLYISGVPDLDNAYGFQIISSNNVQLNSVVVYGTGSPFAHHPKGISVSSNPDASLLVQIDKADVEAVFYGIEVIGSSAVDITSAYTERNIANLYTESNVSSTTVNGGLWESPNSSTVGMINVGGSPASLRINGAHFLVGVGASEISGFWSGNYQHSVNGAAYSTVLRENAP